MSSRGAGRRRVLAWAFTIAAVVAAGLALWAQTTGGFRVRILEVPLSVRGALRPALASVVFAIAAIHFGVGWRSPLLWRILSTSPRALPWIAAVAAALTLFIALVYGSRVASASDPSGYVSQAALWLKGDLRIRQPDVGGLPWPDSQLTFSPLGYRPTADGYIVPTYAPGLPLLMAAAWLVAGTCGPFIVAPLCAGILVWTTYLIGARMSGRAVGAIAALAVAVSPAIIFMMLQPMSDVPNAAFWTLALFFAVRSRSPRDAVIAGVMSGVAVAIRPNLALLAAFPAILTLWTCGRWNLRELIRRAALFAAGCAPFVLLIAAIFNNLYGSPLRSGYGSLGDTYWLANLPLNLDRYPRWFYDSQGPAALAFLVSPIAAFLGERRYRVPRLVLFAFIWAVLGCYLFYIAFDDWWYLRFVLPAFPFVFILGADAVGVLAARFGRVPRAAALLLFGSALVAGGLSESDGRDVVGVGDGERRYADAAAYVQTTLPAGAVVMTMQHSGSISYYTDKLPFRFDNVSVDWIDRAIETFRLRGREVYVLLDDWEMSGFEERHRGQRVASIVRSQPLAVTADGRVRLFATDGAAAYASPVIMPATHGCLPPAGR